jgi:hypothetical protein
MKSLIEFVEIRWVSLTHHESRVDDQFPITCLMLGENQAPHREAHGSLFKLALHR